jgi:ethanolamine-phosphate cytidylyltransferase
MCDRRTEPSGTWSTGEPFIVGKPPPSWSADCDGRLRPDDCDDDCAPPEPDYNCGYGRLRESEGFTAQTTVGGQPIDIRSLSRDFDGACAAWPLPAGAVPPAAAPLTVYADGVFDLFHPGHLAFLDKARAAGGPGARLLVGVIGDADAAWKRTPVMSLAERAAMVRACARADRVIEAPPLVLTGEFLDEHGIGLVVHGDDSEQAGFFRVPIERGIMRYVQYEKGISTSGLIARVLALYGEAGSP